MTNPAPSHDLQLVDRLVVAERLGVCPNTVDNLVKRRELTSVTIGRRRLFDLADVRAFVEGRKATGK